VQHFLIDIFLREG